MSWTVSYVGFIDQYREQKDELMATIDAVLSGGAVSAEQKPSRGCGIKWLPGREPDYQKMST